MAGQELPDPNQPHELSTARRASQPIEEAREESKPPAPAKAETQISRADFGRHEAEDFEPSSELRTSFEKSLKVITSQIEQYQRTGKPLTNEQKDFLVLYKKLGNKLLDSAEGWSLANLVMEQEMFLRLAAIGKDIELDIKRKGFSVSETGEITIPIDEIRGWVNEHGLDVLKYVGYSLTAPVSLPIKGLVELVKSARKHDILEAKFKLENFQIDTSRLPREYKAYIDYISPTINTEAARKFLLNTAEARLAFYETLGLNLKEEDLEAATPWQRFRPTPIPAILGVPIAAGPARLERAQENLDTEWMRVRRQALEKASQRANLASPDEVARAFFTAQQDTIRHFLDLHLKDLAEAKFGVREAGAESREEPKTISSLEKRLEKLKDPEESKKKKIEAEQEAQQLQTQITQTKETLEGDRGVIAQLDQKEGEKATLEVKLPVLRSKRDDLETRIEQVTTEQETLEGQRTGLIGDFDENINNAGSDAQLRALLLDQKSRTIGKLNEQIGKTEEKISQTKEEQDKVKSQINRLDELNSEIQVLKRQKNRLRRQLKRAKEEFEDKQTLIEAGLEQTVQGKVDQLEAVVSCLRDYDRVVSESVFSAPERMLTVQDLTSAAEKDEYGTNYMEGYLRILDHLLGYTKASERKRAFDTAKAILSPRELAQILNNRFNTRINVRRNSDLEKVLERVKRKKISQTQLAGVFIPILEFIENKGMKLE